MAEAVLIWAYGSPVPFVWCRVFFGLRGHRGLAARWALASAIAVVWPLYAAQYAIWRRVSEPGPMPSEEFGDQVEAELHALYP